MTCLQPLEFSECVIDGPEFREKLLIHEKEIDVSYKAFKDIANCIRTVYKSLEDCSEAFTNLATTLEKYKKDQDEAFDSYAETEDEKSIKAAVSLYSEMINNIETMRNEHILGATKKLIYDDIQKLKDDCLTKSRQETKEFKKFTTNYYQKLEKYAATKFKSEADYASIDREIQQERKEYTSRALDHVMNVQQTQEQKTFRLVHTLSLFIQMLNTYHHQAWDHFCDQKKKMDDVNCSLFRTEENYTTITENAEKLKHQFLGMKLEHIQKQTPGEGSVREGYLFIQTKKSVVSDSWTRTFCLYDKLRKTLILSTSGQQVSVQGGKEQKEEWFVEKCERRPSSSIDRRFCFDIHVTNKQSAVTLQALSQEDLNMWMTIMDGKEPVYARPGGVMCGTDIETVLCDKGIRFFRNCIGEIEKRGLDISGIYRISGRAYQNDEIIRKLSKQLKSFNNDDPVPVSELELIDVNTLCSLVKSYIKHLREPLATFILYDDFIAAGKIQDAQAKFIAVSRLVRRLPPNHLAMFALVMRHLNKVSQHQDVNLMTAPNLGVCFSPTVFRPAESSASLTLIRESKFAGDVITILIERCSDFFPASTQFSFKFPPPPLSGPMPRPTATGAPSASSRLSNSKSLYVSPSSNHHSPATSVVPINNNGGDNNTKNHCKDSPETTSKSTPFVKLKRYKTELRHGIPVTEPSQDVIIPVTSTAVRQTQVRPPPFLSPKPQIARKSADFGIGVNSGDNPSTIAHNTYQKRISPTNHSSPRSRLVRSVDNSHLNTNQLFNTGPSHLTNQNAVIPSTTVLPPSQSHPSPSGSYVLTHTMKKPATQLRRAKTLYVYIADDETQLSFDANKIVTHVTNCEESGWLEGTIEGRHGRIPSSYVEMLPL